MIFVKAMPQSNPNSSTVTEPLPLVAENERWLDGANYDILPLAGRFWPVARLQVMQAQGLTPVTYRLTSVGFVQKDAAAAVLGAIAATAEASPCL